MRWQAKFLNSTILFGFKKWGNCFNTHIFLKWRQLLYVGATSRCVLVLRYYKEPSFCFLKKLLRWKVTFLRFQLNPFFVRWISSKIIDVGFIFSWSHHSEKNLTPKGWYWRFVSTPDFRDDLSCISELLNHLGTRKMKCSMY